jgi:hypothetical protein
MSISLFGMAQLTTIWASQRGPYIAGLLRPTATTLPRGVPIPTQRTENPSRRRRRRSSRGSGAERGGSSGIPSSRADTGPGRATGGEGDDAEADPVQGAEQEEDRPSQPPRQGAPRSQRYACRNRLRRPPLLD